MVVALVPCEQLMIPFETNVGISVVTHIQKTNPKSTINRDMLDLIRLSLAVSQNLTEQVAPVLEHCAGDGKAVKVTEVCKHFTLVVTVVKTMPLPPQYISEQGVVKTHLGV